MRAVAGIADGMRRWCLRLSVLEQDAGLYLASGALAFGTLLFAISSDYQQWAAMALGPYLVAAVACFAIARRRRREGRIEQRSDRDVFRRAVVIALLLTTVLIPLGVELVFRAQGTRGAEAQVEVGVIERCGDRVAHHENCYLRHPGSVGINVRSDAPTIDDNSYFPYLPGMIPFGMINAISAPPELRDSRVALSGFTLVVVAAALMLVEIPSRRRWRIFQVAIVLPTGALPMVTGGDDLPVIALMLLALALAQRRRPVASGLAIGLAASTKFTAWPLLLLLALGERDRRGRRAILRYALAALAVLVPILAIGIGLDPRAFFLNAIEFPLGLTRIKSPAASPMIGTELVALFPAAKTELIGLLGVLGLGTIGYGLWRWPPDSPTTAARFTGLAMGLAILIAPATRFGYFIYPLDLLTWALLLKPDVVEQPPEAARREVASPAPSAA